MTFDLAVEAVAHNVPASWKVEEFRRHATLVDEVNAGAKMPLLSLASTGIVAPRSEEGGMGKQIPSESTIERYWIARPGNLVVNPMWLIGGGIGVSQITGAVSPDYRVYKLGSDLFPSFIHHLLRSQPYRDQYRLYTRAETTFDRRVSKQNFHPMPLLIPPLEEQRRIAEFLDFETSRIDSLVDLRRQQLDRLDERYNVAISEIAVPGINAPSDRNALWPWLPASMRTARLGYMARVQSGVTVHGARESSLDDAVYPYLRVANVQGEEVDLSEVKNIVIPAVMAKRSTLRPGDVVMTEANGNPDNLGRGAVWYGEIPEMVHQNHVFAIRVDQEKLLPEYLSALLASTHGRRYFRFTSTQVGIATTSSSKVLDFPVPVLPVEEQRALVDKYQQERVATKRAAAVLTRQLSLLAERRQALITAAVTGQLDVTTAGRTSIV
ncbi:hypothetical protein [Streptomyces violaceusniger]|uniref:restriction endonuclease subunit S n=1 Tax=Streptomyces violaceusniger TaxID=68280 RepID=UPI00382432B0